MEGAGRPSRERPRSAIVFMSSDRKAVFMGFTQLRFGADRLASSIA
jgi:hypothetical protein